MAELIAQSGKKLLWSFASHLQVERVGAKVEFARPLQRADRRDDHLLKDTRLLPDFKHAATSQIAQISDAGGAIIKAQPQMKAFKRLNLSNLHAEKISDETFCVEQQAADLTRRNKSFAEALRSQTGVWERED